MKKAVLAILLMASVTAAAQTKIIAHRGYWKTVPETSQNSLQSLANAQKLNVYGSEFDVRMSRDGKLVVNHDEDHAKMVIADTDYRTLKKTKLSNGEKIPTLKTYLKSGKKNPSVKLIVELKPAKTKALEDEMVKKTIAVVEQLKLQQQCEFISFSKNICLEIERLRPQYTVQYLNGDLSPREIKDLKIDGIDYHYNVYLQKHPDWLQQAKELGLITNAWTVDNPEVYQKLKDQGIGFITTNLPETLNTN